MATYRERVAARQAEQGATIMHVAEHHPGHRAYLPDALEWQAAPPALTPGAEIVVLDGDPTGEGLFTIRVRWPADYQVHAHWHPTTEYLTILSGTFYFGMGDVLDTTQGTAYTAGAFIAVPGNSHHYAWTDEGVVFQLHAMAPFAFTYVDPANDPRNRAAAPPSEAEELAQLTQLYRAFLRSQQVPAVAVAHE
jgi:hypothetical protein